MSVNASRPANILLVENEEADIQFLKRAFGSISFECNLHIVRDGIQAMSYLQKEGEFEKSITPDIVLLDIDMPIMSGLEVLSEIKSSKTLRSIPVIMLTTSDAEEDVIKSYNLGTNSYVKKPSTLKGLKEMATKIEEFWFNTAVLPHE